MRARDDSMPWECRRVLEGLQRIAPGFTAALQAAVRVYSPHDVCKLIDDPGMLKTYLSHFYSEDRLDKAVRLLLLPAIRAVEALSEGGLGEEGLAEEEPAGSGAGGGVVVGGLGDILEDAEKAFSCAVSVEKASAELYEVIASRMSDGICRDALLFVAREARNHAVLLASLAKHLGLRLEACSDDQAVTSVYKLIEAVKSGNSLKRVLRVLAGLEDSLVGEEYVELMLPLITSAFAALGVNGAVKHLLDAVAWEEKNHSEILFEVLKCVENKQ